MGGWIVLVHATDHLRTSLRLTNLLVMNTLNIVFFAALLGAALAVPAYKPKPATLSAQQLKMPGVKALEFLRGANPRILQHCADPESLEECPDDICSSSNCSNSTRVLPFSATSCSSTSVPARPSLTLYTSAKAATLTQWFHIFTPTKIPSIATTRCWPAFIRRKAANPLFARTSTTSS